MTHLEFFKNLPFEDGLELVKQVLHRFPLQYGTTLGLDGHPQIRPLEFKFEEGGKLYFDTVTFYTSYKELQAHPYLQLCICDQETMTYLRLGGQVHFTQDERLVEKCFEVSPVLTSQFGNRREVVVAYYLSDVWVEFTSFSDQIPNQKYQLPNT